MTEDMANPGPRIRAVAKVIHDAGVVRHGWVSPYYKKSYEELEATDPIGFEEFNDLIAAALEAGDAATK